METILTLVAIAVTIVAIAYKRQLLNEQARNVDLASRLASYREAWYAQFEDDDKIECTCDEFRRAYIENEGDIPCPCDGCCCGEFDCELSDEEGVNSPS